MLVAEFGILAVLLLVVLVQLPDRQPRGARESPLTPEAVAGLLAANLIPAIPDGDDRAPAAIRRAVRSDVGGSGRLHVRLVTPNSR